MPANIAAFQPAKKAAALTVADASYPKSPEGHLVIRNAAVAINPVDWMIQSRGNLLYTHLKYPFVLGFDVAGEVVSVGEGVTLIQVGDRVLGFSRGSEEAVNDSAQGAFQLYTVLHQDWTTPIPPGMSFEQGAVLPLGVTTAAAALFDKSQLDLSLPTEPARPATGKTVIVWGGSTSVGCCAIQLAVAAGYEVLSTASKRNHDYLRKLGASHVWEYSSPTVVEDIVAATKNKTIAGAVAIGTGSAEKCMQILEKITSGNKFVAMTTFPLPEEVANLVLLRTLVPMVTWIVGYKAKGVMKGVKSAFVSVVPLSTNGIGRSIFVDFLPKALAAGTFVSAPEALVVGHGLGSIQEAFDLQKKGVSAKKIVVTI